jgi:hypothetical protein
MDNPVVRTLGALPPPALPVFLQVAVTANRKERFKRVPYGIGDGLVVIRRGERNADMRRIGSNQVEDKGDALRQSCLRAKNLTRQRACSS